MLAVEAGEEKDDCPRDEKERERYEMLHEQFPAREFEIADRERKPQGEHEHEYIPRKEQEVFTLGDKRHIGYHYTKCGLKQGPKKYYAPQKGFILHH